MLIPKTHRAAEAVRQTYGLIAFLLLGSLNHQRLRRRKGVRVSLSVRHSHSPICFFVFNYYY